jgi:CBS domain-containing protein
MRPITAADVMNPRVRAAAVDWTLPELADFLIEHEISGAPVVDTQGRLLGVVSVTDIAGALAQGTRSAGTGGSEVGRDGRSRGSDFFRSAWPEGPSRAALADLAARGVRLTVREIMTPEVFTVTEDAPVSELALTLIEEHVHRLLVTRGERVVGIVSTSDLLGLLVEDDG